MFIKVFVKDENNFCYLNSSTIKSLFISENGKGNEICVSFHGETCLAGSFKIAVCENNKLARNLIEKIIVELQKEEKNIINLEKIVNEMRILDDHGENTFSMSNESIEEGFKLASDIIHKIEKEFCSRIPNKEHKNSYKNFFEKLSKISEKIIDGNLPNKQKE